MSAPSRAKYERNMLVVKARRDGKTLNVIANEFDISSERVRQICAKGEHEKDHIWRTNGLLTKTYNMLARNGIKPYETAMMEDSELLRLRGFGRKSLREVREVFPSTASRR